MPHWIDLSLGIPGQLDADTASLLAKAAEANLPPLWTMPPIEARKEFARRLSRANPLPPAGIATEDITIAGPAGALPMRLYRRDGSASPHLLLFFHGGGFVLGDRETHDAICRIIAAASGTTVALAEYRLAPEHPYPAAIEDGLAVLDWAAGLGLNGRLGVAGDSAGGTLAAVMARHARDRGMALALQMLIYPAVDQGGDYPSRQRLAEGYLLTAGDMGWFRDQYFGIRPTPVLDPDASPLRAEDLSGLAPALVLTCGFDPLVDEGKAYARALRAAGVSTRSVCVEGGIHGCLGLANYLACGRTALAELCRCWTDIVGG